MNFSRDEAWNRILFLMKEHFKIKQKDFANMLGYSQQDFSNLKRNRALPTKFLVRLQVKAGISTNFILYGWEPTFISNMKSLPTL